MKNKILIVTLMLVCLLLLAGCGKSNEPLGIYSYNADGFTVYYEFTKEGKQDKTVKYHSYLDGIGDSETTYEYKLEKQSDGKYTISLKNIITENEIKVEYDSKADTIKDEDGNTYSK